MTSSSRRPGGSIFAVATAAVMIAGILIVWLIMSGREARLAPTGEATEAEGPSPRAPEPGAPGPPASRAITPRPFPESEPVESAAARGVLEIEMIGPTGRAAAGARLVLFQGEKVFASGVTNAQGIASFACGSGKAGLIVVPDDAPTHSAEVSIEAGRRMVELPQGAAITGRVEVTGGPPEGSIELYTDQPIPRIERAVYEALKGAVYPRCRISPSGTFELAGLKPGSGWCFGPRATGHRIEEVVLGGTIVKAVEAPAAGVLIRLTRLPFVRARAVYAQRRLPVAGARCDIGFVGERSWGFSTTADAGGVFVFPAANEREKNAVATRIEIRVRDANRVGGKPVVLEPPPTSDFDLGDVEVPESKTIRFVVRDEAEKPIEGAFARTEPYVDRSTRTDAQGRGVIVVSAETASFKVGALKHAIADVAIPDPLPDPLPVVLRGGTGLEVRVVADDSKSTFTICISTPAKHLFSDPAFEWGTGDAIYEAAGASTYSTRGPEGAVARYGVHAGHVLRLAGVAPGVPLKLEAFDSFGQVLANETLMLASSEWKPVDLRVTRPLRSIRGRVRDAAGEPVFEALVVVMPDTIRLGGPLEWHEPWPGDVSTDSKGSFTASGYFGNVVHIGVMSRRFPALVRDDLALPPDGVELEFVLHPAIRMMVKVLDSSGAPIRDLPVRAEDAHRLCVPVSQVAPGCYELSRLPIDTPLTIQVSWAQQQWTRTVTTTEGLVEVFKMPDPGRVLISWGALGEGPFVLELVPPGSEPRARWPVGPTIGEPERTFESGPIVPGEYEIRLRSSDATSVLATKNVTVRAGETARVTLEKP